MKEYWKDTTTKCFEGEKWCPIAGYQGYEVSNFGRIRSIDKQLFTGKGAPYIKKGQIRRLNKTKHGYLKVDISINNTRYTRNVHRLVATTFLPNPNNYPEVNHKDEDKTNNCVSNLEWCDRTYNANYGTVKERISNSLKDNKEHTERVKKHIKQVHDLNKMKVICINTNELFESVISAANIYGFDSSGLSKCCRGEYSYYGTLKANNEELKWRYLTEDDNISSYILVSNDEDRSTLIIKNSNINKLEKANKKNKEENYKTSIKNLEKAKEANIKKVICVDTNIIYDSIADAGIKNNLDPSYISKCCRGKAKTCGGLRWKFYSENKDN